MTLKKSFVINTRAQWYLIALPAPLPLAPTAM